MSTGYLQSCTADFTFDLPGRGGISGIWKGKQALYELACKAMAITDGTIHEEVEDTLVNDQHHEVLSRDTNSHATSLQTITGLRTPMKSEKGNSPNASSNLVIRRASVTLGDLRRIDSNSRHSPRPTPANPHTL